jgi:hypothetical protein
MKKYLFRIGLGFMGMFIAHIFILIGFATGIKFPIYLLIYPIVYSLITLILTQRNPEFWLSNCILIFIIPFVYWYTLLWSDRKIYWTAAIDFKESSGMLLILPFTFLIAL